MFRSRRTQQPESIDWPALLSLLEDDDRRAALQRVFPDPGRESFVHALRRLDPQAAEQLLASGRRLHTAEQLVDWPTVAVAGMLNSGKTSLVATFLSPPGRARTLRGNSNDQGTHRFVLWLPKAWQSDAELWGLLISPRCSRKNRKQPTANTTTEQATNSRSRFHWWPPIRNSTNTALDCWIVPT